MKLPTDVREAMGEDSRNTVTRVWDCADTVCTIGIESKMLDTVEQIWRVFLDGGRRDVVINGSLQRVAFRF